MKAIGAAGRAPGRRARPRRRPPSPRMPGRSCSEHRGPRWWSGRGGT